MERCIRPSDVNLMSATVAAQALNHGWTRLIPWPDDLGEYGTASDGSVDQYVEDAVGTRPGSLVSLGDGNPVGIFSACAGRDEKLRPVIRLSLRVR